MSVSVNFIVSISGVTVKGDFKDVSKGEKVILDGWFHPEESHRVLSFQAKERPVPFLFLSFPLSTFTQHPRS